MHKPWRHVTSCRQISYNQLIVNDYTKKNSNYIEISKKNRWLRSFNFLNETSVGIKDRVKNLNKLGVNGCESIIAGHQLLMNQLS